MHINAMLLGVGNDFFGNQPFAAGYDAWCGVRLAVGEGDCLANRVTRGLGHAAPTSRTALGRQPQTVNARPRMPPAGEPRWPRIERSPQYRPDRLACGS